MTDKPAIPVRFLPAYRRWDPTLADLVTAFVAVVEPPAKFAAWSAIVDHVLRLPGLPGGPGTAAHFRPAC